MWIHLFELPCKKQCSLWDSAIFNISETEMREIERIEESQMRNIFKVETGIQVPIHLMYLDGGQLPARYTVKRFKLNFLQYILQQNQSSLLYRMLKAQQNEPVRGDWLSECMTIMQDFGIDNSLDEISLMKRTRFRKLTKQKSEDLAFQSLLNRKDNGSKGRSLRYGESLQMADYLCPNMVLSVEEQRQIFQIRSRVNPLPANKGEVSLCPTGCKSILENNHILSCTILNPKEQYNLDSLINGNLNDMKKLLRIWNSNIEKIEESTSPDSI